MAGPVSTRKLISIDPTRSRRHYLRVRFTTQIPLHLHPLSKSDLPLIRCLLQQQLLHTEIWCQTNQHLTRMERHQAPVNVRLGSSTTTGDGYKAMRRHDRWNVCRAPLVSRDVVLPQKHVFVPLTFCVIVDCGKRRFSPDVPAFLLLQLQLLLVLWIFCQLLYVWMCLVPYKYPPYRGCVHLNKTLRSS